MFFGIAFFENSTIRDMVNVVQTPDLAKLIVDGYNQSARLDPAGDDYYAVVRLSLAPPEGWHVFGTHIDSSCEIEFTKECDLDGYPIGERPWRSST